MEPRTSNRMSASARTVHNNYSTNNRNDSQLFTSIPALSDAASYLAQTTSYLTGCFSSSSEQDVPGGDQELMTFSSGEANRSLYSWSTIFERSAEASTAPSMDNGRGTTSFRDRSQPLISNNIFQNGASVFQGCMNDLFSSNIIEVIMAKLKQKNQEYK